MVLFTECIWSKPLYNGYVSFICNITGSVEVLVCGDYVGIYKTDNTAIAMVTRPCRLCFQVSHPARSFPWFIVKQYNKVQ